MFNAFLSLQTKATSTVVVDSIVMQSMEMKGISRQWPSISIKLDLPSPIFRWKWIPLEHLTWMKWNRKIEETKKRNEKSLTSGAIAHKKSSPTIRKRTWKNNDNSNHSNEIVFTWDDTSFVFKAKQCHFGCPASAAWRMRVLFDCFPNFRRHEGSDVLFYLLGTTKGIPWWRGSRNPGPNAPPAVSFHTLIPNSG